MVVGSGFLVGRTSVLAAAHNVQVTGTTSVRFARGVEVPARLIGDGTGWVARDTELDLAVLTLSSSPRDALQVRYAAVERDPRAEHPNVAEREALIVGRCHGGKSR